MTISSLLKSKKFWLFLIIAALLIGGGIGLNAYLTPLPAMPEAQAALHSNRQIQVTIDETIAFRPAIITPTTGLIFYPGGLVEPEAYAPMARDIAEQGYLVVIAPMPYNLAILNPERANDIIAAHPEINRWAVGGHSVGGVAAAQFVKKHPNLVQGLIFWAAYPTAAEDLSQWTGSVACLYATNDGLATEEDIAASRSLLPPATQWTPIIGGNHAQFGWYGPQEGDKPASITRQEQQQIIVAATRALLLEITR